jgi:hypothetical protein
MHVTTPGDPKRFVPPEYDEREWAYIDGELPGWEPWQVGARVRRMPDGEMALIGLRIEPLDDFEGGLREQQITAAQLRSLPIRFLLSQAAIQEAFKTGDLTDFAELVLDGWAIAQDEMDDTRERDRAEVVGERQARLERVAALYQRARALPRRGGPRRAIASALGVSVGTVDRLLREARAKGILAPYDGNQGRHGKGEVEE